MRCCGIIQDIITGVIPTGDPVTPPLTSAYCVQWVILDTNNDFPCVAPDSDVNGNTTQGEICGSQFQITDFEGVIGNTFFYQNYDSESWYAQVLRPNTNPELVDLGYYAYLLLGSIPITADIIPTNSNCTPNCYTATFDVEDVSTDGFTAVTLQDSLRLVDMFAGSVVTFDNPNCEALYLAEIVSVAGVEPDATVSVTINSPTNVTLTICTLLNLISGRYGDDIIDKGAFNFTQI